MRPWRKLYKDFTHSDRLAVVSDGACALFTAIVVYQDDEGRVPWTMPMVKSMTAFRPWTFEQATGFKNELVKVGELTEQEGFVILHNGKRYNGALKTGSEKSREPQVYATLRHPTQVELSKNLGRTEAEPESTKEKRRIEERRIEERRIEKRTTRASHASALNPDWFQPLETLTGFKPTDHSKAVAAITLACERAGVSPAVVVQRFADFWPRGQVLFRWRDPVATLVRTVDVEIGKILAGGANGATGRPAAGSDPLAGLDSEGRKAYRDTAIPFRAGSRPAAE